MIGTRLEKYVEELAFALELHDVPDQLIEDITRQVRSHVHDTGEDPETAFGKPAAYAAQYGPRRSAWRYAGQLLAVVVLSFGGGWLQLNGVLAAVGGTSAVWGWPPVAAITVGTLGLIGFVAIIVVLIREHRRRQR